MPTGTLFANRRSLFDAGVHRDIRRGICGSAVRGGGAESIVLSGGYEDDVDLGDVIYYTGQGSRDKDGTLIADQEMKGLNNSLARCVETGVPVRLIRATTKGLRYDGLFVVEDAWLAPGKSGFVICRYMLRATNPEAGGDVDLQPDETSPPLQSAERVPVTHYRMMRDGRVALSVKKLYRYTCQVCQTQLATVGGFYAEAAHIVPLGFGHAGVDHASNVLCLCPNHHVLLDHGGISLTDDWAVIDRAGNPIGKLVVNPGHGLNPEFAKVHRQIMGFHHD
ncbi:HNH endonuclease [Pimelobacter simplex]|nr:HNH endonuclease [Pimelobacter simplex]UUW96066.1 HNH endonuclease [Pimelobacter simplex]